jgi:DNA-binding winged helix-turn-helix (wHTH) protein/Tol biopolymer transport system component
MSSQNGQVFAFEGFRLDPVEKALFRGDQRVPLTPKVFDTLHLLVSNAGHLVEKETILNAVWEGRFVEESNLTHNIKVIRKALGDDAGSPRFIETVPRRGYRFITSVSREDRNLRHPNDAAQSKPYVLISLGIILFLFISGLAFVWYRGEQRNLPRAGLSQITDDGGVAIAAVSPDGGTLVYARKEELGESLWKRRLDVGEDTQLLPPAAGQFVGLAVTPSGDFAYYTAFAENAVTLNLSRVSLSGGQPESLPIESDVSVTFSPDGKRLAYTEAHSAVRQTMLKVADTDGTNSRTVITTEGEKQVFPIFRAGPVSWSPDGSEIACVVEETENNERASRILLVNPEDGSERYLSQQTWPYITSIVWRDDETLALVSVDPTEPGSQIWSVSRRTGSARRLVNDASSYSWLSAANGSLYAVRDISYSSIFITDFDDDLANPRTKQIFNEPGVADFIDWSGDRIFYNSQASGKNEIWQIDLAGTSAHQLTQDSKLTFGFSVSPADGTIVFSAAQRQGNFLFLADGSGHNVRQLTSGKNDSSPRFTPDGKEVIYQQGSMIKPTLWRVSANGGDAQQITGYYAQQPSISPDGVTIAYQFMDFVKGGRVWRLGLMDRETGRLKNKLDLPIPVTERRTAWRPGDDLLTMIFTEGNSSGILLLAPAGGAYRKVPNLTNHRISAFAWSPDGMRLAFAANQETRDVVLVEAN